MLKILYTIFDILFPPRTHELIVRAVTDDTLNGLTNPNRFGGIEYLLPYQHPIVTALITENKFFHNQQAARLLASALTVWLENNITDAVLIPIPLSPKRRKARGYNQVEEVLKYLPKQWKAQCNDTLLIRNKHTEAQTSLKRDARLQNMIDAFGLTSAQPASGTVVIIDDVVTTGATLYAAKACIEKQYGEVNIILLGLAH